MKTLTAYIIRPAAVALAFILCLALCGAATAQQKLIDYVNPFVATGGDGFGVGSAFPGPSMPFGMAKPGPDTAKDGVAPGFYHCSGYYYGDNEVRGFSQNRMHGTGVPDYGNILVMPAIGKQTELIKEDAWRSKFSHSDEVAKPGYYSVLLKKDNIKSEITTGDYTGHYKFTFPVSEAAQVVVQASHFNTEGEALETDVWVDPGRSEVSGWFHYRGPMSGRDGGVKTYFVIQTWPRFSTYGTWRDGMWREGDPTVHGKDAGAVLGFKTAEGDVIQVKAAISYLSVDQARINMEADGIEWDFDGWRQRNEDAWENLLSRVSIEGGAEKHRRIFYTAVYHSLLMPTNYTEAGDVFLGFDRQQHEASGFRYYTDFSMWDTFRTEHPLLTLLYPEYERDMVVSLLKIQEYGGYIPKWPLGAAYTNCMTATPADAVITDSYLKGIKDFDAERAYSALREIAMTATPPGARYGGRGGIEDYIKLGYLPADKHGSSTAETLEFAFEDFALGQFATALGKKDDAAMFYARSKNYKNVWNPKVGFFDGRNSDGSFLEPFSDISWRNHYTEGDAWQWLWFVPHDVPGLMELMGGREAFLKKLDEFFTKSHKAPDTMMPDNWYWHGNEPDLHAAYLYIDAGRADRAQEEIRWVLAKKYKDRPDGLDGNDDAGTMSAWFIFSSMGIYPIVATTKYYIGSPVFTKSSFKVGDKQFTILANGASEKNLYVQKATLNGKALSVPFIDHAEIAAGGTLELEMGPQPGTWGVVK